MADTIVQFRYFTSGVADLTLELYSRTGGTILNGAGGDALAADANTPGLYKATVTQAVAGVVQANVLRGGSFIGGMLLRLADDTGVYDLVEGANLAENEETNIATALLDLADAVETGITLRKFLRAAGAALAGLVSGAETSTVIFRAINVDGTTRITATVDADGNRSAITLNL